MFDRLDIPGGARARVARFWAGVLLGGCLLGPGPGLRGELVSSEQAATAVSGWLRTEPAPLREPLSGPVKQVEEFKDKTGASLYYVVYLEPAGFVVVPAEDTVEPMVAFASAGRFDPSLANPLGALVSKDLAGRVGYARGPRLAAQDASMAGARQKWQRLAQAGQDGGVSSKSRAASVPDVRVAPLTSSRWGQTTTHWGYACYNYYTPPYAPGDRENYPCGCVATVLAQLMRFYAYPTSRVGAAAFSITVDGEQTWRQLRGGDGLGGPYAWASMPLDPANAGSSELQAIGALTYDVGVRVNMSYAADGSSGYLLTGADALLTTFQYSRAVKGFNHGGNLGSGLNGMINPNLHAGFPVLLGIVSDLGGHAVVCDGYGYSLTTLYHHLNLGWSGNEDAWYALPTIDTSLATFTTIQACVFNIFVTGSGEIVAGRVTDPSGVPLAAANVTAVRAGGGTYSTVTDTQGLYALARVPSASQYALSVTKSGYVAANGLCATGTSSDYDATSGNYWGADFTLTAVVPPSILTPPSSQAVPVGTDVTFCVTASGPEPLSFSWRRNGVLMAGATANCLTLSSAQAADDGSWLSCLVSNVFGTLLSQGALLSVGHCYEYRTWAGHVGGQGDADGAGCAAWFSGPSGTAVDITGNLYVADTGNHTIRKITPTGQVLTLAGLPGNPGSTDGLGSAAQFNSPTGVAVDTAGNIYVADSGNNTIRSITPSGQVATLAGQAGWWSAGSTDGWGSAARFNDPTALAVDGEGNVSVADTGNDTIRRITPQGQVSTLAGQAAWWTTGSADGPGNVAQFHSPTGIALDATGNAYVADSGNHTIRIITSAGNVATLAGLAENSGSADGPGSIARFNDPTGIAVDRAGNLYVADSGNHTLRKITAVGMVTTLAGLTGSSGSADGFGSAARFDTPWGVAVDSNGRLYVSDQAESVIRVGTPAGSGVPPFITEHPASQTVPRGSNVCFAVSANGSPPFSYQWRRAGTNLLDGVRIRGSTTPVLTLLNVQSQDAAEIVAVVSNTAGSATSAVAELVVTGGGVFGTHRAGGYLAGGTIIITCSLSYTGAPNVLGWSNTIPTGWAYRSGVNEGNVKPHPGDVGMLLWTWIPAPASPVTFSYTLAIPAGETGVKTLRAWGLYQTDSLLLQLVASPDPLVVHPGTFHTADTDYNGRLSLLELTRVIELYNYRAGGQRTGEYRVQSGTEDGFAPGAGDQTGPLHSADMDGNWRISLLELTRVIELYNSRTNGQRTGEYHTQNGTEDGFAPGH